MGSSGTPFPLSASTAFSSLRGRRGRVYPAPSHALDFPSRAGRRPGPPQVRAPAGPPLLSPHAADPVLALVLSISSCGSGLPLFRNCLLKLHFFCYSVVRCLPQRFPAPNAENSQAPPPRATPVCLLQTLGFGLERIMPGKAALGGKVTLSQGCWWRRWPGSVRTKGDLGYLPPGEGCIKRIWKNQLEKWLGVSEPQTQQIEAGAAQFCPETQRPVKFWGPLNRRGRGRSPHLMVAWLLLQVSFCRCGVFDFIRSSPPPPC